VNDQDDTLNPPTRAERAASKLHDPTPQRKKYVVDLLYKFLTDQISYAELTGVSQKELYRISEIGHVKLKHGRLDEAHKIFDCLVKIDHLNPFYHCCLGLGLFRGIPSVEIVLVAIRLRSLSRARAKLVVVVSGSR